jgi:soluble lytic murein transglycosylase
VEFGSSRSQLGEGDFRRARILLEAGLEKDAQRELNHLFRRARSLEDRTGLADLYASVGEFHQPQRLMVDAYTVHLARGPDPTEIDVWWHAWPSPFPNEVQGVTESRRLQPEIVYAIMREESGYRPGVVSVSGARGLLQLMPSTAERVARREAMGSLAIDDLFQPSVNIRLGGAYLEELLGRFDGRASAAIASYNAGPDKVKEWLTGEPMEDDEWVERIPYEQTRGYVKRVLRSVHAYRVLY